MHRVSPNNPVRRRLIFEDDEDDRNQNTSVQEIINNDSNVRNKRCIILEENLKGEAKFDNSINILHEMLRRDRQEHTMRWNFDFAKEEALPGQYDWYMKKGEEWVHMEPKVDIKNFKYINENTPYHVKDENAPVIKKRKINLESKTSEPLAKRKIDFDQPTK